MDKVLKEKIISYNKENGYSIDEKSIIETLIECGKTLKTYDHDKHRWYTTFYEVKQLNDFYFQIANYENSGDEPALDEEDYYKMVLESAVEVEPYETTIIDYRPKNEPNS